MKVIDKVKITVPTMYGWFAMSDLIDVMTIMHGSKSSRRQVVEALRIMRIEGTVDRMKVHNCQPKWLCIRKKGDKENGN